MSTIGSQSAGSSGWQLVFISFAVVLVLFEILRGWNRGIARQLARLAALIAAYFVAFFGGNIVVPLARPFFDMPDRIMSIVAGAILALAVYVVINGLGTFFFRKTKQHESMLARLFYGLGGAIVGLFFGAFLVWILVVGVRSLGSIADVQVRQQAASQTSASPARTLHAVDVRRGSVGETNESSDLMTSLARLKNSLELGTVGDLVKKTDPVHSQVYETLGKLGEVVSDAENAQRFLTFPGAEQLANNPRIIALRDDPEVPQLIKQGRFMDLLQNRHVIDALNDPTLTEEIRKFDLRRALDYSIREK